MPTGIEWTNETWNPVVGCDKISPGCKKCYAIRDARRLAGNPNPKISSIYEGLTVIQGGQPNWTGVVRFIEERLEQPLHWREPRRIFVNSMSDLFHEDLPDWAIEKVLWVATKCPQHMFQILTKRAKNMRRVVSCMYGKVAASVNSWPIPNIWLGVFVEDQKTAEERIPLLLQTPAAVRFVSYEPALGPVDFSRYIFPDVVEEGHELHWVIVGGESGPGARPFDIAWARNTIAQCKEAGVACFVKQLGGHPLDVCRALQDVQWPLELEFSGGEPRMRDRKGGNWNEWPADIRVREYPELVACS